MIDLSRLSVKSSEQSMDRSIYQEEVLEHYRHPQNFGVLKNPTHTGAAENPLCGDSITLELRVKSGKVADIGFTGSGCALSTASASLFTEWMRDKSVEQLKKVKDKQLFKLIKVPITPARHQCVLLPLTALKRILDV